ncbi:hypothetical protein [Streptomyces sp. AP-93]|nr:hypothetical protein [Streptomyces sp. AP-93]
MLMGAALLGIAAFSAGVKKGIGHLGDQRWCPYWRRACGSARPGN